MIYGTAGSGKTTLLKIFHEMLSEKFSANQVSLVNLKEMNKSKLTDCKFGEDVMELFKEKTKTLNSKKFKSGMIKILFDGFDDLSPNYKNIFINILNSFNEIESNRTIQIFITSNINCEKYFMRIENERCLLLQNLTKEEQTCFLLEYWHAENPNLGRELLENCAKLLTEQSSSMSSVLGRPLIIQGLARICKNDICENFSSKIKNLSICQIFEKMFHFSDDIKDGINVFKFLAIANLFDTKFASELELVNDINILPLDVKNLIELKALNEHGLFEFNRTHVEFIAAKVAFEIIKFNNNSSRHLIKLLISILLKENFQITRMFLNEMLDEEISFSLNETLCDAIENQDENILAHSTREGLSNIFLFIVVLIKMKSSTLLAKVLIANSSKNDLNEYKIYDPNFNVIFSNIKDEKKIAKLLKEIFTS